MNILLYGIMCSQIFFYFSVHRTDRAWMKAFVGLLFLADTLNSVFNMWWIYNVLINNYGNLAALENADWLFESEEALGGIIAMLVQSFFAWRILKLTRNYWLVGTVMVTALVGGLSGIGTAIGVAMLPQFAGLQRLKVIVILWLVGTAVCDVIITVALTWHLRSHRTGLSRTNTLISRIVRVTVSNGLLTAGFALADVIAYLATPRGIHIAFNYALVKLYGNSVMSSLNSRAFLSDSSGMSSSSYGKDIALNLNPDASPVGGMTRSRASRPAQVVVNVETHEMIDVGEHDHVDKGDIEWASSTESRTQERSDDKVHVAV